MHPHVRRLSTALAMILLASRLATAGPSVIKVDLELPDAEGILVTGNTTLLDFHPTTGDWVGGRGHDNGGALYTILATQVTTALTCPQFPAGAALGINTARSIVGTCPHQGTDVGFLRSASGQVTTLLPPGTSMALALGLNDGRVVVGFAKHMTTGRFQAMYYRTDTKKFPAFNLPLPNVTSTILHGVNNREEVVGYVSQQDGPWQAFCHCKQGLVLLTIPGAIETYAVDINDKSQVIGAYVDAQFGFHPFFWEKGQFYDLHFDGAFSFDASSLTNDGRIGGYVLYFDSAGVAHQEGYIAKDMARTPLVAAPAAMAQRSAQPMTLQAQAMEGTDTGTGAPLCQPGALLGGKLAAVAQVVCAK